MRDPAKIREEILDDVLESSSRQLGESARNIEKIKSILHWAKTPRERTAVNIILDDQKKAAKALARLVDDLSGIAGN
ncbi:MAG: hypothetical protein ACREAW_00910 [Nitrososphaera sp.]